MSKLRRLQSEQDRHRHAFEVYFSQGGSRSHERVAKEIGASVATVKSWSRSFGWQRRVDERDAHVAREVADRSLQSGIEEYERNLKIVRVALMKLAKGIADGKVKMQMGDLDRLIRLESFLREGRNHGEPSTAEELILFMQKHWDRFSSEEQHTAMNKLVPGWQSSLTDEAAIRRSGPVLVLPEDSEHVKGPVFILPDNGSSPRSTREVDNSDGTSDEV